MRTLQQLQFDLQRRFVGSNELAGKQLRTRSKIAKTMVCEALGLTVPSHFARTVPRFPSENLDVAVQKANNFQLWNGELEATRRYAFIILNEQEIVTSVQVLTGEELAPLDRTGVATIKRQAAFPTYANEGFRVVGRDTDVVLDWLANLANAESDPPVVDPLAPPDSHLLTLDALGARLLPLIGTKLPDPGAVQDRLRGQKLHETVTRALGYISHSDTGQHPDLPHQLLELKLQTSPTIDLGLIEPTSVAPIGPPFPDVFRHIDTRYAIFGGLLDGMGHIVLTSLVLVSGENFFSTFRRFGGLSVNSKLQFRLPPAWWG